MTTTRICVGRVRVNHGLAASTPVGRWRLIPAVACVLLGGFSLATPAVADLSASALHLMIQEAILRAKPAVALVTSRVDAEAVVNCGRGPVKVAPSPFMETGTGWFVDGRGYLITNAHVVDPAHRVPRWVLQDLARKAIEKACVDPALARQGVGRGERPDLENDIRARVNLSDVELTPVRQLSVLLSSGKRLSATLEKFSAPMTLDAAGAPTADSGRDLALLRVPEGTYPALDLTANPPRLGDAIHII